MESDTTSHLRPSILTSFLSRGSRPRSTAASPTGADSPGINNLNNNGPQPNHHHLNNNSNSSSARRRGAPGGNTSSAAASPATGTPGLGPGPGLGQVPATNLPIMPAPTATSLSQMLRRRRSNNGNLNQAAAASTASPATAAPPPPPAATTPASAPHSSNANAQAGSSSGAPGGTAATSGPAHRIRLVPHLENSRALHFDPITRECREGAPAIRIGRFTDRSGTLAASTNSLTGKIAFKSKVVSRGHAELWCEANGKFYVKDTSSSSGTFLNHIRLSSAGVESRPHLLKDGDILQLGVDYQGGTEEIYRCVKIRVEIGREWQAGPNPFNTSAMAQLKALSNLPTSIPAPAATNGVVARPKTKKTTVSDCCICLFPVTVCQALFIAPCSHSFHYKCIRGTLSDHHPGFSCPLCRSFHNLEADVEVDLQEEDDEWEELPGNNPEGATANGLVLPTDGEDNHDASDMVQDDLAAMDISDGNGAVRRSIDDDDDLPLGFQTAAEHNDRRLLPQSLHQNHLNQTLSPSQTLLSNLPPPPPMPSTTTPRRAPRRGTMVQGQTSGAASPDDIDRGFETDTGVVGFGGETDMDVDEPRHHQGSHSRTGSGRGRAGMYNQNVVAGNQTPHAAYSGSAGMSSAPNLLRPGSAMGHTLTAQGQPPSNIPGNATPPGLPYHTHSPVAIRSTATTASSNPYHGMGMSSSNPSASRMMMVSGSLPGTSSHLLGDAGTNGAGGIGDRTMLGGDKATEDFLLSGGEEQGVEAGASGGGPGAFGFGSKRKR